MLESFDADRIKRLRVEANTLRETAARMPESDMRLEHLKVAGEYDLFATELERRIWGKRPLSLDPDPVT